MANVNDYDGAAVTACFSVLLEFFTILGEYRESLVLVGGWTAPMIISEPGGHTRNQAWVIIHTCAYGVPGALELLASLA